MIGAEVNFKRCRSCKGKNYIVDVSCIENKGEIISAKVYSPYLHSDHYWISGKRLKPYSDPDADGKQWLFLGYVIQEQNLIEHYKYSIYENDHDSHLNYVAVCKTLLQAKKIIINDLLGGKTKWEIK